MALDSRTIESIQELKVTENPRSQKLFTNREIAKILSVWVGTVSTYTKWIVNLLRQWLSVDEIKEQLELQSARLEELSHKLDEQDTNVESQINEKLDGLQKIVEDDIEDRTDKSAVWFDENDICHFNITDVDQVTWEKDKIAIEIPLDVIDAIFLSYSSSMGNSMSEHEIMHEFKLYKYYKNPTKIRSVFRSRLGLNKNCTVRSYHTDAINKAKWEEEYNRLVEERVAIWIKKRYEVNHKQQNKDLELKYLRKQIKEYQTRIWDQDIFLEAMKDYQVEPIHLNDKEVRNWEKLTVLMWDRHWDANPKSVEDRVGRMVSDIISRDVSHVNLVGMGDWFEFIVQMHADQELDNKVYDPREKIQWVIGLMSWMLNKLAEAGITVDFKMLNWNHDRWSQNNHEDRYRLHWYRLTTVLQYAIQSKNVKIENLWERINSFVDWDICYIVWHWETDMYKKSPEEIISMHWKPARYYILWMWHLHSIKKKSWNIVKLSRDRKKDNHESEWANYTQIIVPALCDEWRYSSQVVVKRSAPWAVYVEENIQDDDSRYIAPDVVTKRL